MKSGLFKKGEKPVENPRRIVLLSVLLVLSFLFALHFESRHAGHEEHCHEEDCPIYLLLQIINYSDNFTLSLPLRTGESLSHFYQYLPAFTTFVIEAKTLVTQKIKLVI